MTQISVCYHEDEAKVEGIVCAWWAISANRGQLNRELPGWKHYE